MSVPVAYCEEMGCVVNIFEAREHYFAQPKSERERLNFFCADDACREAAKPMMVGVNYDKLSGTYVQRPHFKAHNDHLHATECPWVEYKILEEELEKSGISPRLSNLKQTEIVGLFKPATEAAPNAVDEAPVDWAEVRNIRNISNTREKLNAFKAFISRSVNKTSYLQDVCACFEALTPEERKLVPLKIGDLNERTYHTYFTSSFYCLPDAWYPRIYHGKANVREWHTGYSIRFESGARATDDTFCTVTIFVSKDMLENFRGRNQLRQTLNAAVEMGQGAVYCYVFGDVVRPDDEDGNPDNKIDVLIGSLHSLVIKLVESETED